jgi:hypothetical protein
MDYWHTGKYDIKTDKFVGGGVAAFTPDKRRIVEAPTVEELARKLAEHK